MGARRGSRRRRRPASRSATAQPATTPDASPATEASEVTEERGGFGKAAILLALLLGMVIERIAIDLVPSEALDAMHLVVAIGIAFFVARWYRGFMRRTLARSRANRRPR